MYGVAEVAQGFTRMCALHKGLYVLRTTATKLLAHTEPEKGTHRIAGVLTNRGEVVRARSVLAAHDQLVQRRAAVPAAAAPSPTVACRRMTVLTTGPLLAEEGLHLCVVPPSSFEPPLANLVQVLQLDFSTGTCPRGYNVTYLSQAIYTSHAAADFQDLQRVLVELLSRCSEDTQCVMQCTYVHETVVDCGVDAKDMREGSSTDGKRATQIGDVPYRRDRTNLSV